MPYYQFPQLASHDNPGLESAAQFDAVAALGDNFATKVDKAGDTMTGALSLPSETITATDGTGASTYPVQSADPSIVATKGRLFASKNARNPWAHWRGDIGLAQRLGLEPWGNQWFLATPLLSTSLRSAGTGTNVSSTGTISHPAVTANGQFAQLQSAASANVLAQVTGPVFFRRGAVGDLLGGLEMHTRIFPPDASYNETGAATGCRHHYGFTSSTVANFLNNDYGQATTHNAFFARESVNGGAIDTNLQFVTSDGANKTVTDTGMPWVAQHVYSLHIECAGGDTTIYWRIDDKTAGTTASGSATTNLPGATTLMQLSSGLQTIDAVARNMQFAWIFGRQLAA